MSLAVCICLQGQCVCRGEGGTQPPSLASTAEATARHSRSIFLPAGTSHDQHSLYRGSILLTVLTRHYLHPQRDPLTVQTQGDLSPMFHLTNHHWTVATSTWVTGLPSTLKMAV